MVLPEPELISLAEQNCAEILIKDSNTSQKIQRDEQTLRHEAPSQPELVPYARTIHPLAQRGTDALIGLGETENQPRRR